MVVKNNNNKPRKISLYEIFLMFGFNFVNNNKIAMIKKKKSNNYTEENHI